MWTSSAERIMGRIVEMTMPRECDRVTVNIAGGRDYDINFAPLPLLGALLREAGLAPGRCILVTDKNVAQHWLDEAMAALDGWEPLVIVLPAGEKTKSAASLGSVCDKALSAGIDRSTPVIALGGGVVGDLAGFAAATLLRGLPLVHVPTSLMAQVDSAIGGKVGINHAIGKNLIGAFHQPRLVCADPSVLSTLPMIEWTSGLAEVIKHALIADPKFVEFLERRWEDVLARESSAIRKMIRWSVAIKAAVVSEDEEEKGAPRNLEFRPHFWPCYRACGWLRALYTRRGRGLGHVRGTGVIPGPQSAPSGHAGRPAGKQDPCPPLFAIVGY